MPRKKKSENQGEMFESRLERGRELNAKYFQKAYVRAQERLDALTENMAFYEGSQYSLESYQSNKPWVVQMNTPYATLAIDTRVASLVASNYAGELEPFSPDDKEAVDGLQDLYSDIWEELRMNEKISNAIKTGAVVREAYIHIIADKNENEGGTNRMNTGKLYAYFLNPSHVWVDPKVRDFKEARYVCITERVSKQKAFSDYPFLKDNIVGGSYSPEMRGEIYNGNDYSTEQDGIFTKVTTYVKEYKENSKSPVIHKYITIEDVLCDDDELTSLHYLPIAQFKWKSASDSPYGLSLMDELISLQKAVNAIESAITNTSLAYASPSMMVSSSCGVDPKQVALTVGSPGVVYMVDGDLSNAIAPVIVPQLNDRIVNIKTEFQNTISTIAGVTSTYLGSLGTSGNTAGGAELAINRAKIIENIVMRNVEDFVEQLTFILTDYIVALFAGVDTVYTRTRGDNGQLMFNERHLSEGIRDVQYSFYVDLSARTQYSKDKEKQTLQELYQMERQYDSEIKLINEIDILDETDLRTKDALKARYNRLNYQSNEQKLQLINTLNELQAKYGIDQNLIQQAQIEVMESDEKMEVFKQVTSIATSTMNQMQQAMTSANQQAVEMGIPQQAVQQASQMLQDQGVTAQMLNITPNAR